MPEPMTREEFDALLLIALEDCEDSGTSAALASERLKPHLDALLSARDDELKHKICVEIETYDAFNIPPHRRSQIVGVIRSLR